MHSPFRRLLLNRISLILGSLALLSACGFSGARIPDLKRIYEVSSNFSNQPPVVFIHGAFGSRLRDRTTQGEVWPGGLGKLIFGNYASLALQPDPVTLDPQTDNIEAFSLVDKVAGHDYYGRLLNTLQEAGGYRPTRPGTPPGKISRRVYVFVYDWRQDIAANSARLGEFVEQIIADYGDPALKVDIVSHSMGALITRYYLRFGKTDVLDNDQFTITGAGARHVRKVVMLGPPNYGSIKGLQNIMKGYDIGWNSIPVEVLATMPGAYQIMPHPDRDWMVDLDGKRIDRDLYDKNVWKMNKWGLFDDRVQQRITRRFATQQAAQQNMDLLERYLDKHMRRARRFHRAINAPYPDSRVYYIVFGGDCQLTPARCLLENVAGKQVIRIRPGDIARPKAGIDYHKLMLEPGDGSVTKPSLLARNSLDPTPGTLAQGAFPLAYSMFLCESHSQLTGNTSFQDNLLNVLLVQQTLSERAVPSR